MLELNTRYAPLPPETTCIVLRLLFPEDDVARKYGMQERTLAQQLATVLMVSTASDGGGNRLVAWDVESSTGCLGQEVERVMKATSTVCDSTCVVS